MRQGSHGTHDFYEQRAEITKVGYWTVPTCAIAIDLSQYCEYKLHNCISPVCSACAFWRCSLGVLGSFCRRVSYGENVNAPKELLARGYLHAVALEADFPDAFRANLYARGFSEGTSEDALADFKVRGDARNPGTPEP